VYMHTGTGAASVVLDIRVDPPPAEAQHDAHTPVPTLYATQEHAPTGTPTAAAWVCTVLTRLGLNVRSGPGVSYSVMTDEQGNNITLGYNVRLTIIGAERDSNGDLWYQTADGWVAAWLVGCG
jgi:uncharacterized protein YgiM (DUF1202 family)